MQLLELKLTHFKGLSNYVFTPNGGQATLYGSNGTGKTTLFDAYTWLLYDKGSEPDGKGFSPKTTDACGQEVHHLDNTVEGRFRLDNGQELTLRKTLTEDWTAKRGEREQVYVGNRTKYFIDEVPVSQAVYQQRLSALCPPEKAAILTRPLYFATVLHWQERRRLLLELCGDVSEAEVLGSSEEFARLRELLQKPGGGSYTADEWRLVAAARCKTVQELLRELPDRLDEARRSLPEAGGCDEQELTAQREELRRRRDELLKSAGRAEAAASQTREALESCRNAALTEKKRLLRSLEEQQQSAEGKALTTEFLLRGMHSEQSRLTCEQERLLAEQAACRSRCFQGDGLCPTCGQPLPADRLAEAKKLFAESRDRQLSELAAQESTTALRLQRLGTELAENSDRLSALQEQSRQLGEQLALLRKEVAALPPLPAGEKPVQGEAERLQERLSALDAALAAQRYRRERLQRLEELLLQQRKVQQEYERLLQGLRLCEQFVKARVSMLTARINSRFTGVCFRLFEQQLNGGMRECCEVLVPTSRGLKRFDEANSGARLCAGLELVHTLGRLWGICLPVFVDNAESVVQLPQLPLQLIRLVVSAADTVLRAELSKEGQAADGMD